MRQEETKIKKYLAIFLALGLLFSFHVQATDSVPTDVETDFSFLGKGSARSIELNDQHCGYLPEGCHAHVSGNWNSFLFKEGVFEADIDTEWQHATSNGKKGFCAPVHGTAELRKRKSNDKIFVRIDGTDCDSLASSEVLPHVYRLTFTITGGTDKYKEATGEGSISGLDLGINVFLFRARGSITLHPQK